MKLSNKVKELQSILEKVDIDDFYLCEATMYSVRLQGTLKDGMLEKYSNLFGGKFEEQIFENVKSFVFASEEVDITFF